MKDVTRWELVKKPPASDIRYLVMSIKGDSVRDKVNPDVFIVVVIIEAEDATPLRIIGRERIFCESKGGVTFVFRNRTLPEIAPSSTNVYELQRSTQPQYL